MGGWRAEVGAVGMAGCSGPRSGARVRSVQGSRALPSVCPSVKWGLNTNEPASLRTEPEGEGRGSGVGIAVPGVGEPGQGDCWDVGWSWGLGRTSSPHMHWPQASCPTPGPGEAECARARLPHMGWGPSLPPPCLDPDGAGATRRESFRPPRTPLQPSSRLCVSSPPPRAPVPGGRSTLGTSGGEPHRHQAHSSGFQGGIY